MKLMDIRSGNSYPSCALSNFAPHPFVFDGIQCNSMEGFLQSLKFKDEEIQKYVCTLVGFAAKKKGSNKNWQTKQILYWKGKEYPRSSDEYKNLLDTVYEVLFTQNDKARKALLATGNSNLTHSIGKNKKNETVLTAQEFCSRLIKIRKKFQNEDHLMFTN
jgi:predicted NAD-dependent protein-ADP-ribosyltransferase YbiA (DUF1768 family)